MSATNVADLRARFRIDHGKFSLDVDLTLPGRGVTALFGPSGSGKTTMLRAMAGLDRAPGGFVAMGDEIWQDDARGIFVPVHRRALGYVFQEANLFPHFSVRENLAYGRRRIHGRAASESVPHLTALLGLEPLLDRDPEKLSGGERQRVAIARALLASPRLLLLDEPLASLDLERKREILPYLERLHAELEIPVVYVSHAPDEVLRLADHLVLLSAGKVTASGPLTATLARIDLPEVLAQDVGVVLEGRVAAGNEPYGLLELEVPGGRLHVAHAALPLGHRLRVQIQSRDVSVALTRPHDTSVLNLLPATIVSENATAGAAHVHLLLDAGGTPLVARVTRWSRDRLSLTPGTAVWAQIKAVAVLS